MKLKKSNQKGFTIVELMAVLSIVGILSATGISNYEEYRSRAYDARVRQEMSNLRAAMVIESTDKDMTNFFYQRINGPGKFNAPYNMVNVSKGTTLIAFRRVRNQRRGLFEYTYQYGWHRKSNHRFLDINYRRNGRNYDVNYKFPNTKR